MTTIKLFNDIPLVNDLLMLYNVNDEELNDEQLKENIYKHVNKNVLKMYKYLNIEFTDQDIYDYIKFIDFSGIDVEQYKKVVKLITPNNFKLMEPLFDNINIRENLLPLLPYNIIKKYKHYNLIEELWIVNNFQDVFRENIDIDKYIIFNKHYMYYKINNKIYTNMSENSSRSNMVKDFLEAVRYNTEVAIFYLNTRQLYKLIDSNNLNYALSKSVTNNNIKLAEHVIKFKDVDIHYNNVLKISIRNHNFEMFKILCKRGALEKNKYIDAFNHSCESGEIEFIKYLYEYNYKYNYETAIVNACKNNNFHIIELIIQKGLDLRFSNDLLLQNCAIYGNMKLTKYLLENNCDAKNVNILNVIKNRHYDIVKLLHERGANLMYYKYLYMSISHNNLDFVKYLSNIGLKFNDTAINKAAKDKHYEIINYFLEQGADKKYVDKLMKNTLMN